MHTYIKPVGDDGHDTDRVCGCNNLASAHTGAIRNPEIPLLLDWAALEHVPEEDDGTPDNNDGQAGPDDPRVDLLWRKSQEKDSDTEFDKHHVDDIGCRRQSLPLETCQLGPAGLNGRPLP